ncbi:MAG: hypothetical protein U0525_00055 [Patescibacteria group bacterium]
MNTEIMKSKKVIVIASSILALLVVTYIILLLIKQNVQQPQNPTSTSPTPYFDQKTPNTSSRVTVIMTTLPNNPSITPQPPENLGGDIKIPEQMVEAGSEREKLMNASPLNTEYFTVRFNYKTVLYDVSFTNPNNEENADRFREWKEINYPSIGMEEFHFEN